MQIACSPTQAPVKLRSVRFIIAGSVWWGGIVLLLSFGAQWLVYEELLHDPGGMRIVSPCIAALITAILNLRLQTEVRRRRVAAVKRYEVIAEMNHHIRNALQVISYQSYVSDPAATERMRQAVDRIDWALREVLPSLERSDATAGPERQTATTTRP